MKNSPCLNCQDRRFKCHSVCEKYIEYAEIKRIEREKRLEENERKQAHHRNVRAAIIRKQRGQK